MWAEERGFRSEFSGVGVSAALCLSGAFSDPGGRRGRGRGQPLPGNPAPRRPGTLLLVRFSRNSKLQGVVLMPRSYRSRDVWPGCQLAPFRTPRGAPLCGPGTGGSRGRSFGHLRGGGGIRVCAAWWLLSSPPGPRARTFPSGVWPCSQALRTLGAPGRVTEKY